MGCRQNHTAHRCRDAPGPPAPATGRSAARTRAVRPRCHRRRPTRGSWTVPDRPVHGPPRRAGPDHPSPRGPGPPSPVPPEGRPRRRPAPTVPTWRTAAPRDLPGPTRPPQGSTQSARQRSGRPPGSHPAAPAALRSTMHTTPDQRPAPTRAPRQLPPEPRPRRLPDSTQWHPGRSARETCTRPVAPRHHRSPPTRHSTMPCFAPTHPPKIQATRATPHVRRASTPTHRTQGLAHAYQDSGIAGLGHFLG
jgi:hypothetical protein